MNPETNHKIIVLTAPSGAGKTTIAKGVMQLLPGSQFSVSATTRKRRLTEKDGVDYYFITPEEFRQRARMGDFVEYEEVYSGDLYGTLRDEIDRKRKMGPVLLDIDVRGAESIKNYFGDEAFVIFVKPPSIDVLIRRLVERGTENPASLQKRIDRIEMEMGQADRFDASVVNDDVERALDEVMNLLMAILKPTSLTSSQSASPRPTDPRQKPPGAT